MVAELIQDYERDREARTECGNGAVTRATS